MTETLHASKRDPHGRFHAALKDHVLLDVVADVALYATEDDRAAAVRITRSTWDAARSACGPQLPTAQAIVKRLGLSWRDVVELALVDAANRGRHRGVRARGVSEVSEALIGRALRAAAHAIGTAPSPHQYDAERARLERYALERTGPECPLPASKTILRRYGSWSAALAAFGIEAGVRERRGRPAAEVVEELAFEHGGVPPQRWVKTWAQGADVEMTRSGDWARVLAEVDARFRARGEEPPMRLPTAAMPELETVGPRRGTRANPYTREDAVQHVATYLASLRTGETPRERGYRALQRSNTNLRLMAASALQRHGRFQDLVRDAERRTREGGGA